MKKQKELEKLKDAETRKELERIRQEELERQHAATKIGAAYRGRKARREVSKMKNQKKDQESRKKKAE